MKGCAYTMDFDASKVTAVIAVAAIISPILTATINNIFQLVVKAMDNRRERHEKTVEYKRKVLENYLRCFGGELRNIPSNEAVEDYKKAYILALLYVPSEIREEMIKVDNLIDADKSTAKQLLENLIPSIEKLLGKL